MATEGILLGMGNPLLDISAKVKDELLAKYGLEKNNAILTGEGDEKAKLMPLFTDLVNDHEVSYSIELLSSSLFTRHLSSMTTVVTDSRYCSTV